MSKITGSYLQNIEKVLFENNNLTETKLSRQTLTEVVDNAKKGTMHQWRDQFD